MTTSFTIDLIPDSSVADAPAGFAAAVEQAARIYEAVFHNPITLDITYGWGTYDNVADDSLVGTGGAIGGVQSGDDVSYTTVKALLEASATSAEDKQAYGALPANASSFPGGDDSVFLASAQEKALGDFAGNANAIDGSIGFGTASTSADWVAEALHEIGHAMGRLTDYDVGAPTVMDLFRYDAPGVYQWTGGQAAYFSVDGGRTKIADFGVTSDYADWNGDSLTTNDPFNEIVGDIDTLTPKDIEMMDVLGFGTATPAPSLVHEGSVTVGFGSTVVISESELEFDDALSAHAQETYTITSAPGDGTLMKSGSTVSTFTQADIDNGLISYRESGSGIVFDTFRFEVTNAEGVSTTAQKFQIQITQPDATPPQIVIGAATLSGGNFTLAGAATDNAGVASVEIYQGSVDLGAATLNAAAGTWSDSGQVAPSADVTLEAVARDATGNSATSTLYAFSGGGQSVAFATPGDFADLSGTGGDWDSVSGSSGTVELSGAQATVTGGGDTIDLAGSGNAADLHGGGADTVNGSGAAIGLTSAQAAIYGYHDAITFQGGSGDVANLYDTGGKWDFVTGSGGSVSLTDAKASVTGADDAITFSGAPGSAVSVYGTGANWDSVAGTRGLVALFGSNVSVMGAHELIQFQGSADAADIHDNAGQWDYVDGSDGTIGLSNAKASVDGNQNILNLSGTNVTTVNGSSEAFVFQPAIGTDFINGFTSTDTMQFSAKDFANWSALSGHISQAGANTEIVLDAADFVTLAGVTASSLQASQFRFL